TANNNYVSDNPAVCDRPAQGNTQCVVTERRTQNSWGGWNSPSVTKTEVRGPTNFTSNALYPNAFYGRLPDSCSCRSATTAAGSGSGNSQTRTITCNRFIPADLSPREYQERICKYYAGVSGSSLSSAPHGACPRTPLLPSAAKAGEVIDT